MADQYNATSALELLLNKLDERQASLAAEVRSAIDAGRDIVEPERVRKRKSAREYRKAVAFTDSEALMVAVQVLRAHFVEQPLFAASAASNFAGAAVGLGADDMTDGRVPTTSLPKAGAPKVVAIEIQTETQFTKSDRETATLPSVSPESIREQMDRLNHLVKLTSISESIPF